MGNSVFAYWRDAQDAPAIVECPRCGGEVYDLDPVGAVGGRLLHIDCLTAEEQEYTRIAPAVSFFQEEC